jgi:hypothetical protein
MRLKTKERTKIKRRNEEKPITSIGGCRRYVNVETLFYLQTTDW